MAKWNGRRESGILRKKVVEDKHEDLLVFGYACKLFRDDERALYIDQGKHLIPWMGEASLKIDRYDCRGALSELLPFEANSEDYDAKRWLGLKDSERQIELLCDEERYRSLKNNDDELELYHEEELKRICQKANEVQYNYDVPADPENSQEKTEVSECEQLYIPSPELDIPENMQVPKTVKENTRIEKTAHFVSKQGLQMEILIKTKQADNLQFSFMYKDDPLYPYYKHLLLAIKNGQYKVQMLNEEEKQEDSFEQEDHGEHYLHPSLQATPLQPAPPPLPAVVYKPSPDCTYSQLVNRIQGVKPEPPTQQQSQEMTYDEQFYQQYYYTSQYYEYYKQMMQQYQNSSFVENQDFNKGGSSTIPNNENSITQSDAVPQYYPNATANPYAQIVSNVSSTKDVPKVSFDSETKPKQTLLPDNEIAKAPILYNKEETQNIASVDSKQNLVEIKKPLLSLAQYGSDSEGSNEEDEVDEPFVLTPPTEMKLVIDKMASYVLKNGKDFEGIVKSKGDVRFEFLKENHKFYPYYKKKINEYSLRVLNQGENQEQKDGSKKVANKVKKPIAPVSFSIKKTREEMPKEIKSALPVEESDEDQEECKNTKSTSVVSEPNKNSPMNSITSTTSSSTVPSTTNTLPSICSAIEILEKHQRDKEKKISSKGIDIKKSSVDDFILDLMELSDELQDIKESSQAQDCKKDQVVTEAREKLALQMERKKKAAAFLKLKSVETVDVSNELDNSDWKNTKSKKLEKPSSDRFKSKSEIIIDSDDEDGEIKKHKKSSRKKKSHKRKRSKSRSNSSSSHKYREHKKSKKRHKDVSGTSPSSTGS